MNWLLTFTALFVLDLVWARYTAAITAKHKPMAAAYASAIVVLSGFATISYVNDHWLILPAAAGAFAGTFVGVKR